MNKVLIFGGARTGTTTLSHCLRHTGYAHNKNEVSIAIDEPLNYPVRTPRLYKESGLDIVKCFEEAKLLHKFVVATGGECAGRKIVSKLTAGQLYRVLDNIYKKYDCIKHIHDSIFEMNNKLLFDYATDNKIKILLLARKDLFSVCLSKLMSKQSTVWHTLTDEQRKKVDKAKYEPISIRDLKLMYRRFSKDSNTYSNYLASKDIDYFEVIYEDFLHPDNDMDSRVEKFKDILSYIDWDYIETKEILDALSPKTKQYTQEHYDKIPNIKEIYEWRDSL